MRGLTHGGPAAVRAAFGLVLAVLLVQGTVRALPAAAGTVQADWRLMISEVAVVRGDQVRLGEIASVSGPMDPGQWKALADTTLWASPGEGAGPMVIARERLFPAIAHYLGDVAELCVLPPRLVVQRGGAVLSGDELRRMVVNSLTPMSGALDGRCELRDFRLPPFLFLASENSKATVELVSQLAPGRLTLRFVERDAAKAEGRKATGTVFLDVWKEVPLAAKPLNRGDELKPDDITFVRKNLAFLHGEIWDGRSGPWRVKQPVGKDQVLYVASLEGVPVVAKGAVVNLVFRGNRIELRVPAQALADGAPGDRIPVRNMQSEKEVLARVVDARTVQVQ